MVYGIGVCVTEKLERLKDLGVADSKTLTEIKREEIFAKAQQKECSEFFAYALKILSPHYISVSMLKRYVCQNGPQSTSFVYVLRLRLIVLNINLGQNTI